MIKMAADTPTSDVAYMAHLRHRKLKDQIYAAESESDVRQAVLALYDLDLVGKLEKQRVDYAHPELFIEFKYKQDLKDRRVLCKILSQMLHYLHFIPYKHSRYEFPENFAIADKSLMFIYSTEDFAKYIIDKDQVYFKDISSPSSPHPILERELFNNPIIAAQGLHVIADYSRIWDELEKRGIYEDLHR